MFADISYEYLAKVVKIDLYEMTANKLGINKVFVHGHYKVSNKDTIRDHEKQNSI